MVAAQSVRLDASVDYGDEISEDFWAGGDCPSMLESWRHWVLLSVKDGNSNRVDSITSKG